jgi:hypothetical protein
LSTPIRRLEGITYWLIEDSEAIYDFINKEIRNEWETDVASEHRDPKNDPWLKSLSKRRWSLETVEMTRIELNPEIMNYVDVERGYVFSESLAKRSQELQKSIEMGGLAIWPLIVRKEGMQLVDGYCRYATLKAMEVRRTYAYVGILCSNRFRTATF